MSATLDREVLEALEWFDRDDPAWRDFLDLSVRWPPYQSQAELDAIRKESRWLASSHPFAMAALEVRASYVVGSGHQYKVRAKPLAQVDQSTLDKVRQEIDEFVERNKWFLLQRENQFRLDRDGEVFLRFFEEDGYLVVRYIEPEDVQTPLNLAVSPNVRFGIEVAEMDVETPVAYHVRYRWGTQERWERVDASEVQHRKANCDRSWPRGVPLLYSVRDNLRRVWKLLRNMTTVASIQAAIAIVRKHTGIQGGSVQQYLSALAQQQQLRREPSGDSYQRFPPGAIVDVPPGIEYQLVGSGIDPSRYVPAIQAELRAVAARLAMPEYMLSGDASNANYASTMVAEGPAVKMFERLQSEMIWYDSIVLMRALELAEENGRLPPGTSQSVIIDAEAPTVMVRDRLREAQADQILLSMGVVSERTIAARYGYDLDQERAQQ